MTFEAARNLATLIMALAFIQQSAEHLAVDHRGRWVFALRIIAASLIACGLYVGPSLLGLCAISLWMLDRFGGPYNGGSDKMSLLILWCLTAAHLLPEPIWQQTAFAYLGTQVVLSYFISGQVKVMNPAWRSGQALVDVFAFSAYPVSENLRDLAKWPGLLWVMSWAVMVFEVAFPLTLLHPLSLKIGLVLGAGFHLANAMLFGLNRFFWIWLAAYPALLWLQHRLMALG